MRALCLIFIVSIYVLVVLSGNVASRGMRKTPNFKSIENGLLAHNLPSQMLPALRLPKRRQFNYRSSEEM